jgi:hypothetical protein
MDSVSDLVEHFKLDTYFLADLTQHTFYESDPSKGRRKLRVDRKWRRDKKLGNGAFGVVWLEVEHNGEKRAVKEIKKSQMAPKFDYRKELLAMAKLSKVFNRLTCGGIGTADSKVS